MTVEAAHRIADLLHRYVEAADRKDVAAAVALLGRAEIRFPHGGSSGPDEAREFFGRLWAAPAGHRHDVSTLVVDPAADGTGWTGRAHYTRWLLDPEPVLHTLGEYRLTVTDQWAATLLEVTRTWTRPAA